MSPARSKSRGRSGAASRRQPQQLRKYERADIVKAVLVSAAIVAVTAVLIWMLRPGPVGIPATGGIMNRQPRATWLIFGAIVVGSIAVWVIMRGRSNRARKRAKVVLPIALVIVLLATIGLGIAWPGGLLRHDVAPVTEPEPEPTTPPTTPSTPSTKPTAATGTTGSTGAPGSSGTSGPSTTPPR